MYKISNKHYKEIIELLKCVCEIPGNDLRTVNRRRRALLIVRRLQNKRQEK